MSILTVGQLRQALKSSELLDDMPVWLDGDHEFAKDLVIENTNFGEGDPGLSIIGGN